MGVIKKRNFYDYFDIVKKCIDEWDPYKLLDDAPEDEYDLESEAIAHELNSNMSILEIAVIISGVFSLCFCEEWTIDNCLEPAKQIYNRLK